MLELMLMWQLAEVKMLAAVIRWLGSGGVDGGCRSRPVGGKGLLRWCPVPETFRNLVGFIFEKVSGMRTVNILLTFVAANLKTMMR